MLEVNQLCKRMSLVYSTVNVAATKSLESWSPCTVSSPGCCFLYAQSVCNIWCLYVYCASFPTMLTYMTFFIALTLVLMWLLLSSGWKGFFYLQGCVVLQPHPQSYKHQCRQNSTSKYVQLGMDGIGVCTLSSVTSGLDHDCEPMS